MKRLLFLLATLLAIALPVEAAPLAANRTLLASQQTFDPRRTPDCALWWDASDLSTITQAGGVASQINDKCGAGNHGLQGTGAAQPAVITGGRAGRSVLRFDGSNDRMTTAGALSGNSVTVLFVGKSTKTASGVRVIAGTANGDAIANGGFELAHDDRGTTNGSNTLSASFRTGSSGANTDKYRYFGKNSGYSDAAWVVAAAGYSQADHELFYNGTDQAPYDSYQSSVGVNAYVASSLAFTLGALSGGTVAASIDLGDVVVFRRRLTAGEIAKLTRGAVRKWGP